MEEPTPQIRTQEWAIHFDTPLTATAQQHIAFTAQGLTISAEAQTANLISEKIPVTLEAPKPFLALSAKWTAIITPTAKLTVSVRASRNGDEWSAWQLSSLDGDPRTQAGLFFFSPDSRFIQYQVEIERDAKRQSPWLEAIRFRFISPGATPPLERNHLRASQQLSRAEWHCPATTFQAKRQRMPVQHLIVHHTATTNEAQDWPAVVRTIWNFHAVTNGWRDVGYHYLIDPNGVIYEGRAGGDRATGIHFSCANTGTIGIALLGNYLTATPQEAALRSLERLLAKKCQQLGLDPAGTSWHASTQLRLPHIAGHQDANAAPGGSVCKGTHCPGDTLYSLLPQIRAEVTKMVQAAKL